MMSEFEKKYIEVLTRIAAALEVMGDPPIEPEDREMRQLNREVALCQLRKQKEKIDRGEEPGETIARPVEDPEEIEIRELQREVTKKELLLNKRNLERLEREELERELKKTGSSR